MCHYGYFSGQCTGHRSRHLDTNQRSGHHYDPTSPTSGLTALGAGANTFRWTLPNGSCADSQDDVIITRSVATTAAAGPDQDVCATTATLAGNAPATGVGTWTHQRSGHHYDPTLHLVRGLGSGPTPLDRGGRRVGTFHGPCRMEAAKSHRTM
ncbi:MAG: hypothetical protein IPN22_09325 [Bacteroidetes bacterium]|nr:hypothetical protein [Bacteroidota bacterium]